MKGENIMIKYAAIAFHPHTLKYGYANDCSSREEAESKASRNIESGYVIAAWVADNGYAALAISAENGYFNGGEGQTLQEAEQDAIYRCEQRGGINCYIVCSVYSG